MNWFMKNLLNTRIKVKKIIMHDLEKKCGIAFVLWTLESMGGSEYVVFDIVRKLDKKNITF